MISDSIADPNNPIKVRWKDVADWVVDRILEQRPDLEDASKAVDRARALEDVVYHLTYLSTAIGVNRLELFTDYIDWTRSVLEAHGVPSSKLRLSLKLIEEKLAAELEGDEALKRQVLLYFRKARERLELEKSSKIDEYRDHPLESTAREYLDLLLKSKRQASRNLLISTVENGVDPRDVYMHVIGRSQHLLGALWQGNRISVAEEHYITAATQANITSLYPYVFTQEATGPGYSVVATCIGGELHELGIRMVTDFLQMEAWDTFYLGANTPTADLLLYLKEISPDLLAVSATMPPNINEVAELISSIRKDPNLSSTRIIVGGHPFNRAEGLWQRVGADAMAPDAGKAVETACELVAAGASP